jgi:hypothetical protein
MMTTNRPAKATRRPSKKEVAKPFKKYLRADFTQRLVEHMKLAKAAALKAKE